MQTCGVHSLRNQRWCVLICLACLLISFLAQFSGFVSAGWIYLKGDLYTIHAGLWYRVTCKKGEDCSIKDMVNNEGKDMLEYQIETSIALAACLSAAIFVIVHTRYHGNMITFLLIAMMGSSLSGILALIASGKMGHKHLQQHDEQMGKYGRSVYKTPYSAALTGVGGLLASIVSIALVIEVHLCTKQYHNQSSVENKAATRVPSVKKVTRAPNDTDQQLDTRTSQAVNKYIAGAVSPDETGSWFFVGQTTVNEMGNDIYSSPTVAASVCPGTVVNVTNHVSPINNEKSRDEYLDGLCGNAILENGQHIVVNDIYNI